MMKNLKLKFFFVGICGSSMSALSIILKKQGHFVQGSDQNFKSNVDFFQSFNIDIFDHGIANLEDFDFVVFSRAIKDDNPDILNAKKFDLPLIARERLISMLSRCYKNFIAVSGSHGKSTVSAMIAHIFKENDRPLTYAIGAKDIVHNKNFGVSFDNKTFLVEACEYKNSFLKFNPTISCVLNVDFDHPDFFSDINSVKSSFKKFACQSEKVLILNENKQILDNFDNAIFIGDEGRYYIKNHTLTDFGQTFALVKENTCLGLITLNIFGKFNALNSLFASAVCLELGFSYDEIQSALLTFKGIERRMEKIGTYKKSDVVIDYAHHPTEILSLIELLKSKYEGKKLIAVFQPHTYSRTSSLLNEFISSLKQFDHCFIYKTFEARERFDLNGSSQNLAQKGDFLHFENENTLFSLLTQFENENCVFCFIGAGDINSVAKDFLGFKLE